MSINIMQQKESILGSYALLSSDSMTVGSPNDGQQVKSFIYTVETCKKGDDMVEFGST